MGRNRKVRRRALRSPPLTIAQILRWADEWHERTGRWPIATSGRIPGSLGESWLRIDVALRTAGRGLPNKSSLARLLVKERGAYSAKHAPRLTERLILFWADNHHRHTGKWPTVSSGPVFDRKSETWRNINACFSNGHRGLTGGTRLSKFLAKWRDVPNQAPPLSVKKILTWADAHRRRTGHWPTRYSGKIPESGGDENWRRIDNALYYGLRSLDGGTSLSKLLAEKRAVRNVSCLPRYTEAQILRWADSHFSRTGKWPNYGSGPIPEMPGENWHKVHGALYQGCRGMSGKMTLAEFLSVHRGVRNHMRLPRFDVAQILSWAAAHYRRTGAWPTYSSGSIDEAPNETWKKVNQALRQGRRGLPGPSSLAKLLRSQTPPADRRKV